MPLSPEGYYLCLEDSRPGDGIGILSSRVFTGLWPMLKRKSEKIGIKRPFSAVFRLNTSDFICMESL